MWLAGPHPTPHVIVLPQTIAAKHNHYESSFISSAFKTLIASQKGINTAVWSDLLILLFRFLQSRRPKMFSPVQFKQIHGNFFEANYYDRNIVIEFGTRYVNAAKLCVDAGKQLHLWRETKMSEALVSALQKEDEHIFPYKHVEIDGVSGIFCHHLIAPLGRLCCPGGYHPQ